MRSLQYNLRLQLCLCSRSHQCSHLFLCLVSVLPPGEMCDVQLVITCIGLALQCMDGLVRGLHTLAIHEGGTESKRSF